MIKYQVPLLLFIVYTGIPALFGYLGERIGNQLSQQQAITQLRLQLPIAMAQISGQTQVTLTPYNQKLKDYLAFQNQYLSVKKPRF